MEDAMWRQRRLMIVTVLFLVIGASVGCGPGSGGGGGLSAAVPPKWMDELITAIVGWIEEKTGIKIEKGSIIIESLGFRPETSRGGQSGDFKVKVSYRNTEFTCTPKNVPCSANGVPTDQGKEQIKQAIEGMKDSIRNVRQ
jgi:hypothetical protein